jgi:hypothetical protein
MAYEPQLWKATAFEQMLKHLEGAEIDEACRWSFGAHAKILVFEDNDKAEKFKKLMDLARAK